MEIDKRISSGYVYSEVVELCKMLNNVIDELVKCVTK